MPTVDATAVWIGGLGALVGGVGATVAAVAAWQAAVNSFRAATEAREAMALSVRPSVEVWVDQWEGPGSVAAARVWVQGAVSDWPAADVVLQFRLASGKTGSTSTNLLEPIYEPLPREPPYLHIDIEQPSDKWPPPKGDRVDIVVMFSDVRHGAAYRLTASSDIQRYAEGMTAVGVQMTGPPTSERLSPAADEALRRRAPVKAPRVSPRGDRAR